MANAGKIYLDAQLDTSSLKKQITSLGKTLGKMKIKLNVSNYDAIKKTKEKMIETTKKELTLEQAINQQKKIEKQNQTDLLSQAKKRLQKEQELASLQKTNNTNTTKLAQMSAKIGNYFSNLDMSSLVDGVSMANQLTNVLASGSKSLIQGVTALASTVGGVLGTVLSGGNALIGQAISGIVSMLGNMAQIVVNIIRSVVNATLKIIKNGINLIKKMFNIFKELPSIIEKVVSKLGNMSITFRAFGNVLNYCKNIASQFMSILGQKFSAYSIMNFIQSSLELGSSLTEQMHILEVVTPSFTAYNDAVNKTSEYTKYMGTVTSKLGISTINATKYLANYGSMWKSLGVDSSETITQMSKDMLQLTSDIASFRNMDYDDVFKSLKSVIFGGQTRTGLNLGVDIYVESMKDYATSVGKVWDEMNGAEKSALRLEKVMKDLGFMYGDFEKTSYTWANQTRFLSEQLDNLKAVIGENLIMVFNNFLIILNKCLGALSTFSYAINDFLKSLGLGKVLESTGVNLSSVLEEETGALNDATDSVGTAGSNAAKEIQRSLFGFDKLNNNLTEDFGTDTSTDISGGIIIDDTKLEQTEEKSETLLTKAISNLKESLNKVGKFFDVLWEDFNTYFAKPFGDFLSGENGIPKLINGVNELINNIDWDKINVSFGKWFETLEPLGEFFFNVGADIQEYLINPLTTYFTNNILTGYLDSLSKFNDAVDWEKVRKGISNVLKAVEPVLETLMDSGLWLFDNVLTPLGEWFLNDVWPTISDDLVEALGKVNTWLETMITNLSDETWRNDNLGFLADAFVELKKNIEEFDISGVFDTIVKTIKTANEKFGITDAIKKLWDEKIAPEISEIVDEIWEFIQPYVEQLGTWIVEKLVNVIVELLLLPVTFSLKIGKAIGEAFSKMFTNGSEAEKGVKGIGETIVDCIVNGFNSALNLQKDSIYNAIKAAFMPTSLAKEFGEWISGTINKDYTPKSTTTASAIVNNASVPALANGGYVYDLPSNTSRISTVNKTLLDAKNSATTGMFKENSNYGYNSNIPIILQLGDGTELGSWMIDYLNNESKRTGKPII